MKKLSTSKQMAINMVAAIVSFLIGTGINFVLAPYLVKELGSETYGFIGLANNFVQYATIVTSALNSMSGRFISIEYSKGNIDKASRYFSSVLVADLIIAGVLLLVSSIITFNIEFILNVPENLVDSVKILFALTFATFIISVITAIFTTAAFVKNKLYINSLRDIASNTLKLLLVVILFSFFPAKVYFLAMASLASGIFLLLTNIKVKNKILPEVKMNFNLFSFKLVKVLISAGIWSSIGYLSTALNRGLDLLICNLTLGAGLMGLLSIANTVPHCIDNLITTIANIFTPRFTILYAKDNTDLLVEETKFSSKIMSFLMTAPLAGFIAFGNKFYTLWQPTKSPDEITIIQILSVLVCISYLFTCHTRSLSSLFTVCNKLKASVLISLVCGVLTVIIVLLLIHFTPLGVYAIAGVSSVFIGLKAIVFVPLYAAHILKIKLTTYYRSIFRGWFCFAVVITMFIFINSFVHANSWISFLLLCVASGLAGYAVSVPLIFSRKELVLIKDKIKKKFKKS